MMFLNLYPNRIKVVLIGVCPTRERKGRGAGCGTLKEASSVHGPENNLKPRFPSRTCEKPLRPHLQRLQVLDDLHSFFFSQLAANHATALCTVVEHVPGVRIAR